MLRLREMLLLWYLNRVASLWRLLNATELYTGYLRQQHHKQRGLDRVEPALLATQLIPLVSDEKCSQSPQCTALLHPRAYINCHPSSSFGKKSIVNVETVTEGFF